MDMKKFFTRALLLALTAGTVCLSACSEKKPSESVPEGSSNPAESEAHGTSSEAVVPEKPDENAEKLWDEAYAHKASGFENVKEVYRTDYYFDGEKISDYDKKPGNGDVEILFAGRESTRVVNRTDGYAITIPATDIKLDNTLSAFRTKYITENSILTVTYEDKNPYGATEGGWSTYLNEWLIRYVNDVDFLIKNNIRRTSPAYTSDDMLPGYTVMGYDMYLVDPVKGIEYPYYNIAIVREKDKYEHFYLFVNKAKEKCDDAFHEMIKTFAEFERQGECLNPITKEGGFKPQLSDKLSEETKNYYNLLKNNKKVSWGAFTGTIVSKKDPVYNDRHAELLKKFDEIEGEKGWNYNMDILPTYAHLAYYDTPIYFPLEMASEFAGGNGFNGKPVLQFTYQFTTSNNGELAGRNPMFDIMRGNYDRVFRNLAKDIKAYGKPVLFRLNNEMNTDWTSYCGICSLLDPDIFIICWNRMYDIFEEEGVDNCLWIFNPVARSVPYSNWGEALNYFPSADRVQILGLTDYEMGNTVPMRSFREMYEAYYKQNIPYYAEFPWVISEFGAGCGGEKMFDWGIRDYKDTVVDRNERIRAKWVADMFDCFAHAGEKGYEFVDHIKGAIWFSVNDWVYIDGKYYINNNLELDATKPLTMKSFKEGLDKTGAKLSKNPIK